jgi:L-methionine (R)-S-oxide reductase
MENKKNYSAEYEKVKSQLEYFFKNYQDLSFEAKMTSIVSSLSINITDIFFVGFYVVTPNIAKNEFELQIGPYQSKILATPRIALGKGVCGSAWKENKT